MKKNDFLLVKLGFAIAFPWVAIANIMEIFDIAFSDLFEQIIVVFPGVGVLLVLVWGIAYPFKKGKKERIKTMDIFDDTFLKLLFVFLVIELIVAFIGIRLNAV